MKNCETTKLIDVYSEKSDVLKNRNRQRTIPLTDILKREIMNDQQENDFGDESGDDGFLDLFAKKCLQKQIEIAFNEKISKTYITQTDVISILNDHGLITKDGDDRLKDKEESTITTSASASGSGSKNYPIDSSCEILNSLQEINKNGDSNKNVENYVKILEQRIQQLETKVISVEGLMQTLNRANLELQCKRTIVKNPILINKPEEIRQLSQSTNTDESTDIKEETEPIESQDDASNKNEINYVYENPPTIRLPSLNAYDKVPNQKFLQRVNNSYYDELYYERRQHALNRIAYKTAEETFSMMSPLLLSEYLRLPKKPCAFNQPAYHKPGFVKLF